MKKTPGDIIILHVYQKLWSDDVQFLKYGAWQMKLFLILGYFLPFYLPYNPKNQNFEKMKKMPGDTIILHMCTKNYDQVMSGSWDMVHDLCNYFLFWTIFCPFTPLTARKIKILKKQKKPLKISSFYICVPKFIIRWCTLPEMWCVTDVIVISHFELFILYPFIPLTAQKIKILKKKKKRPWDIIILHKCTEKYDQMMYGSWDMVHDRGTDG